MSARPPRKYGVVCTMLIMKLAVIASEILDTSADFYSNPKSIYNKPKTFFFRYCSYELGIRASAVGYATGIHPATVSRHVANTHIAERTRASGTPMNKEYEKFKDKMSRVISLKLLQNG